MFLVIGASDWRTTAWLDGQQLFGKDRNDAEEIEGDYMRGRGTFDPSVNPNAYPSS